MNFNEYWNSQPTIADKKAAEIARVAAAKAWNKSQMVERQRCEAAINSVQEDGDPSQLEHIKQFMNEDAEQFAAGVTTLIQLVKSSCVEAINSFMGGRKH